MSLHNVRYATLLILTLVTTMACQDTCKSTLCDIDCPDIPDMVGEPYVDLPDVVPIPDVVPDEEPDIPDVVEPLPRYRCPCQDMRFYEVCAPDDDLAMLEAQRLCRLIDPTCDCWDGCELIGWCE